MAQTMGTASFVGFFVVLALCGGSDGTAPPKWPKVYSASGTIRLPYAEVNEGFMAYYDGIKNRSRIDYYATVTTIQLAAKGKDYGKNYKVAPMSTYKVANQMACFLVNGTKAAPVTTQSVLPDLTKFKVGGTDIQKGKKCQLWQYIEVIGTKKNTYTICLDTKGAPVTYVMMGYDTLLGSHYDKYIIEYTNFDTNVTIPDKKFKPPPTKTKCGNFPGPGAAEHRILMNPMAEYINSDNAHIDSMFEEFKQRHNPQYKHKDDEAQRKHYFRNNIRFVHSKNRANLGYSLRLNHLADRSDVEMKFMRGRLYTPGYNGGRPFDKSAYNLKDVPDELDWRLFGAVTPVKDQGVCGSCWSFGTTGTIEGALFLKTGQRIRLSQQQLMDCSWGSGNNACDGGEDFRAYQYIIKNGGIATEASYGPYLMQDGYCRSKNKTMATTLKGYVNVTTGDLQALKIAVATHGPISVAIDASHRSLSFYADGVYYEPQCGNKPDQLDHAVLAVGYGVMNGQAYWLVKNSWSTYWGNDGYVLMSQKDNNCGVATDPTFVLL